MNFRRVALTHRKDGYVISTVRSFDDLYGKYETAYWYDIFQDVKILKGYPTREEAIKGHDYFCNISTEELKKYKIIN